MKKDSVPVFAQRKFRNNFLKPEYRLPNGNRGNRRPQGTNWEVGIQNNYRGRKKYPWER